MQRLLDTTQQKHEILWNYCGETDVKKRKGMSFSLISAVKEFTQIAMTKTNKRQHSVQLCRKL